MEKAKALLSGTEGVIDVHLAVTFLKDALESGGAEAPCLLANLSAAGVGRPPDWHSAFDLLALSADRGWVPAQDQLRLLASNATPEVPYPGFWLDLRRTVDIEKLLAVPAKSILAEVPRIRSLEGFLDQRICRWMMNRARFRLERAKVYVDTDGSSGIAHARTNRECDFDIVASDLILLLIRQRIAAVTGLPPAVMELTKVLNYSAGEQYDPHFDFLDPDATGYQAELSVRGQRLVTFLIYLNQDYAGGETCFPLIQLEHRGNSGDALYFANVDGAGNPDRMSLHAGSKVTRGEKWLLSQWIRNRVPAAP